MFISCCRWFGVACLVVNAEEVSWADHTVTVPDGISLPRLRENGTVRDLDTLVCITQMVTS